MTELMEYDEKTVNKLKEKIALGCRILAKLELSDYLGHVSARVPDTEYVLIKARGLDQGNLLDMTPDQVVMVDLEGKVVEGNLKPPDEVKLHTEIFKARPDVQAVVHTHQPIATIFGDLRKRILPMQGVMAAIARRDIPIFESSRKIVTTEQGAAVAKVLGDHAVVHLRNHGVVTVGSSVEEAVIHTIWLEHQAKLTFYASMIGTPQGMSQEEAELQVTDAGPIEGRWRYYVSLLEK
ncbi:class II aldolase/adducin family protein [Bacillaceae bacterium]